MQKVLIIDTSILCVYLKVPFMEECDPNHDKWDYKRVAEKLSIGDATIKNVANYYMESGMEVEILTGDGGLKAYEPKVVKIPRRRR